MGSSFSISLGVDGRSTNQPGEQLILLIPNVSYFRQNGLGSGGVELLIAMHEQSSSAIRIIVGR